MTRAALLLLSVAYPAGYGLGRVLVWLQLYE